MRASPLLGLLACLVGCAQNPSPPAPAKPESHPAATRTTSEAKRPKSLAEQVSQLSQAKQALPQLLAQFDREIEQAKADGAKFEKAAALQAKIDQALKKPSSPDTAKALDQFRINLARLENKRAELASEFGDTIARLLKAGEDRLAAGNDQSLEIPPALERWLNSGLTPGGSDSKPGTEAKAK